MANNPNQNKSQLKTEQAQPHAQNVPVSPLVPAHPANLPTGADPHNVASPSPENVAVPVTPGTRGPGGEVLPGSPAPVHGQPYGTPPNPATAQKDAAAKEAQEKDAEQNPPQAAPNAEPARWTPPGVGAGDQHTQKDEDGMTRHVGLPDDHGS